MRRGSKRSKFTREGKMKIKARSLAVVISNILFLFACSTFAVAASAEQADNSWLNGKWSGQPPAGGELTMTLSVEKDNQVSGSGLIPQGGSRDIHPQVSGSVNGKQVVLETFFPSAFPQGSVHYDCTLVNDALQCRTQKGNYKTTFKKID